MLLLLINDQVSSGCFVQLLTDLLLQRPSGCDRSPRNEKLKQGATERWADFLFLIFPLLREQQRGPTPETCEPLGVRTARPPVLVQQSSCCGAPGVKTGECDFSTCLWSAACWEGVCAGKASVDQVKKALLRVQTNVFLPFIFPLLVHSNTSYEAPVEPDCTCSTTWLYLECLFQISHLKPPLHDLKLWLDPLHLRKIYSHFLHALCTHLLPKLSKRSMVFHQLFYQPFNSN